METASLFAAIAIVILLAVTSLRFGADSRDRFTTKELDQALRGIN